MPKQNKENKTEQTGIVNTADLGGVELSVAQSDRELLESEMQDEARADALDIFKKRRKEDLTVQFLREIEKLYHTERPHEIYVFTPTRALVASANMGMSKIHYFVGVNYQEHCPTEEFDKWLRAGLVEVNQVACDKARFQKKEIEKSKSEA